MVNRLLTVIFRVDSNPPLEQLGPYRALEAHYKPLLPRQIRPRLSPRAPSQPQTMDEPRRNDKKRVEGAERKKLLGTSPTVFLFNLGPALRAAALFLHLFTKHERKTHQKNALPWLATYQPFAHLVTVLQRRVKSGYKLTFFLTRK